MPSRFLRSGLSGASLFVDVRLLDDAENGQLALEAPPKGSVRIGGQQPHLAAAAAAAGSAENGGATEGIELNDISRRRSENDVMFIICDGVDQFA